MIFKQYLQVTKPGIIFGNLISVIGGFLLASKGSIDYPLFIYTLVGVSLVVASGCVFNNYIDRDIDRKMERTKNRVLVKGLISPAVSLVYATLLGIAGFMLLWFGANPLACWLGVMGFVVYVGVYSLYMKRHSVYGTLIGSLSGAAPPVIGYCAVTGEFDSGAAILLAIFSQYGQDTLQIKEAKNKAERPHADHVRHPEVTYQRACVVQAHAQAFGIFRHPGDKT